MGTKTHNNYESLITFTRASAGHALRPVSYGDELVDTANTASSWTAYGTNTIAQNGDAVEVTYVDNAGGALDYLSQSHGTSEDLTAGKLYRLSFSAKTNQGSVRFQLYGQTISIQDFYITNTEYENFSVNFVSDGSQHLIKLNDMGAGEVFSIKNISVKEVSFDQPDGTLTLFKHPDNIPRVEWDSAGNRLGLLVEESRINLLTQSTMKDVNYTKTRAEITDNQITSPDGTQNASKVNETTGTSGQHFIYRQDVSYTSGNDYTFSVFAKADTTTVVQLLGTSSVFGSAVYANFDIENGTIGSQGASVVDSSIQDVGNGWYRLSVTGTATITAASTSSLIVAFTNNNTAAARAPSYVGDTAQQFYVFGGQVEAGSFPTSYIKSNSGSTTTRSADVASIPVADFGFNTGAGTFVAEFQYQDPEEDDSNYLIGGTAQARVMYNNAGTNVWQTYDGNGSVSFSAIDSDDGRSKLAVAVKTDSITVTSKDGNITGSNAAFTKLMENLAGQAIYIGGGSTQSLNGHIKSVQYYPRRLTNAQLQDLTS